MNSANPDRPDCWKTPATRFRCDQVRLIHSLDDGDLAVRVECKNSPTDVAWFRVKFKNYLCYRLLREETTTGESSSSEAGPTVRYVKSKWLDEIRKVDPLVEQQWGDLVHFVICTADRQLEVVTVSEPEIEEI